MRKAGSLALCDNKAEATPVKLFWIVGIVIIVVVPAAFWTAIALLVCHWLSVTLSAQMVLLIGASICLFLALSTP